MNIYISSFSLLYLTKNLFYQNVESSPFLPFIDSAFITVTTIFSEIDEREIDYLSIHFSPYIFTSYQWHLSSPKFTFSHWPSFAISLVQTFLPTVLLSSLTPFPASSHTTPIILFFLSMFQAQSPNISTDSPCSSESLESSSLYLACFLQFLFLFGTNYFFSSPILRLFLLYPISISFVCIV